MKTFLASVVLLSVSSLLSCATYDRYGPMHGPAGGWPMMPYGHGGWFMWLIFVIGVAIALYFIMQAKRGGTIRETPLEILKKRYAKGEITKGEYDRMKRDLTE